ncbi:B-BOX ZINC FINGER PROTEIN 19 [Salix viminalis]|uniref:B-BOX ZINC FINGER PROTEIN 19 n=1 Tax=Salix viminalis TaxID=40686 RepID=A0A9Q0ZDY7_SALVM|nr:B-BOX ZINC FINGER PROTEIN 19 [Salix viminalis]
MKILCDVCNKEEASVFCTADEAALCDTCDHRVHHANKLASKHHRFSLLHPSSKNFPICDICQEKRAFLFCQQDRAILCRDCDGPIHAANEHTQKHSRFLLTGVKLSATSAVYTSSSSVTKNGGELVPDSKSQQQQQPIKKPVSVAPVNSNPPTVPSILSTNTVVNKGGNNLVTNEGFGSTTSSTISEYLMETLPGWHVEDFLDPSTTPFGFCKIDGGLSPFMDTHHDLESNMSSFSSESLGIWVPQTPTASYTSQQYYYPQLVGQSGFKEMKRDHKHES